MTKNVGAALREKAEKIKLTEAQKKAKEEEKRRKEGYKQFRTWASNLKKSWKAKAEKAAADGNTSITIPWHGNYGDWNDRRKLEAYFKERGVVLSFSEETSNDIDYFGHTWYWCILNWGGDRESSW